MKCLSCKFCNFGSLFELIDRKRSSTVFTGMLWLWFFCADNFNFFICSLIFFDMFGNQVVNLWILEQTSISSVCPGEIKILRLLFYLFTTTILVFERILSDFDTWSTTDIVQKIPWLFFYANLSLAYSQIRAVMKILVKTSSTFSIRMDKLCLTSHWSFYQSK